MNEEIPPRLLLVDDEATLREPLAEYLSRQGFGVSEADSAAKARTLLRDETPDLVLLDIMMPGEDGLSLCRHLVETRDIDIEIGPFRRTGFRLRWTNVTLVDGRRDVPGVKRRVNEVIFEPHDGSRLFVEASVANLFQRQEEMSPLAGDPVRWAKLDENGMHVFSFAILEDGQYELQTYTRQLVDDGLELTFERVVDGEVLRRIDGWAVRAD